MMSVPCCHSEHYEESLIIRSASAPKASQRCFAPLNMTDSVCDGIQNAKQVLSWKSKSFIRK